MAVLAPDRALPFQKMYGLKRVHWHLSHVLTYSLAGRHAEAEAYMVQILRAIHQSVLDGGQWHTAVLLLPGEDPCQKESFGATERELQIIAGYRDAHRRITKPFGQDKGADKDGGDKDGDHPPKGGKGGKK
jgi:hypothetical protein